MGKLLGRINGGPQKRPSVFNFGELESRILMLKSDCVSAILHDVLV